MQWIANCTFGGWTPLRSNSGMPGSDSIEERSVYPPASCRKVTSSRAMGAVVVGTLGRQRCRAVVGGSHHGSDRATADHGDGGQRGRSGPATSYRLDAAGHGRRPCSELVVGRGVRGEGVTEVVEGVHARSSSMVRAGSMRSFASARLAWLLTLPTLQPRTRAVSASLRSSK